LEGRGWEKRESRQQKAVNYLGIEISPLGAVHCFLLSAFWFLFPRNLHPPRLSLPRKSGHRYNFRVYSLEAGLCMKG
jgi:hypothetical protein